MQHHRRTLATPTSRKAPWVGRCLSRSAVTTACGLLLLLAAAPGAHAQVFPESPTLVFSDGFNTYTQNQNTCWAGKPWELWVEDPYYTTECKGSSMMDNWPYVATSGFSDNIDNDDAWKPGFVNTWIYCPTNSAMMVVRQSKPDDPAYDPADWTNVRLEFDTLVQQFTAVGFAWAMTVADDALPYEQMKEPSDGYVFWIEPYEPPPNDGYPGFPLNSFQIGEDRRGQWRLARISGMSRTSNVSGVYDWTRLTDPYVIQPNPDPMNYSTDSLYYSTGGRVFTYQLDWYCGQVRVRYMIKWAPTPGVDTVYYGCPSAADADGICTEADRDDCWCLLTEFPMAGFDPSPIEGPGAVGMYISGSYSGFCTSGMSGPQVDNFFAYAHPTDCGVVCGPWAGWAPSRTDIIPFKFLYEGGLLDFSAGRQVPGLDIGKIDVATEGPPPPISSYNHSLIDPSTGTQNPYCNGWKLYEGLPAPSETANLDAILDLLEPMYTAIDFVPNGSGGFDWVKAYDNDKFEADLVTPNPDYDPVPIVADGTTPINSSLLEAYDWYVAQRSEGGPWANDQYEDCRQWYVILITDGEDQCEFDGMVPNPGAVCEPGQAASKFAAPDVAGVDPLPVYTIGFSETITESSSLECIADLTGGLYLTAENASQLSDALYEVFYRLEGEQRTFSPFKIAPPPSSTGGNPTRDYLAVFPFFQPQPQQTLWSGNLLAFPLNAEQPTLPTVDDCQIDTSRMAWNAYEALEAQIDAHTEADPQRFVYMGSNASGPWARHDLATMPANSTLRTEFKTLLDVSGGVTDVVAQQIVNFVRDAWMDSDADPSNAGPPAEPRPSGYPVLGDFFHSQPVVVNPPNTYRYVYDYGYGNHDYPAFAARQSKRRRVVVAGANDGMLHVFDGGFWNRDRLHEGDFTSDPYDQIHDLGNGTELFAWVPQAVMDRLFNMTSGGAIEHVEQQYMVDGPIAKSDAFIDFDGDGNREWRTVVLASMRRGGRGILALDITQPDPIGAAPDYVPEVSTFAGCRDGTVDGCDGEYPKVLWEFKDTADANGNGEWDLGWTWSEPAVARIAVYNPSDDQAPDDVFVAFFGGGWDENEADSTGTYFYGVDVATGAVLLKTNMSVDLPGGVTALDSDEDGFHDRIYFADTNGSVWRLQFPGPTDSGSTGAAAGTMTRIFDFRSTFADGGVADRQEFFTRPVPVPLLFDGEKYTWAVALGSGDRANLDREDSGIDHFYVLVDAGDTTTRGKGNLLEVDYTELLNLGALAEGESFDSSVADCSSDALLPPYYGWYLNLRDTEKVMFDATVLGGLVYFPTFDPSTDTATSPPNVCAGAEAPEAPPVELSLSCRASGIGRGYEVKLACGIGGYTEFNDIATSQQVVDIDGNPEVWTSGTGGGDGGGSGPVIGIEGGDLNPTHIVTNWRQE